MDPRPREFPLASPCLVVGAASGQARQGGQALDLLEAYFREEVAGRQIQAGLTKSKRESNQGHHLAPFRNEN